MFTVHIAREFEMKSFLKLDLRNVKDTVKKIVVFV